MSRFRGLLIAMLLATMVTVAFAQPPGRGPGCPPAGPEETREMLRTLRIWKLTREVGITPEQGSRVFPLEQRWSDLQDRKAESREQLARQLQAALQIPDPGARAAEIDRAVRTFEELERDLNAEGTRVRSEILAGLSPDQRARYMIFHFDFPRQMRETLANLRGRRGGRAVEPPLPEDDL